MEIRLPGFRAEGALYDSGPRHYVARTRAHVGATGVTPSQGDGCQHFCGPSGYTNCCITVPSSSQPDATLVTQCCGPSLFPLYPWITVCPGQPVQKNCGFWFSLNPCRSVSCDSPPQTPPPPDCTTTGCRAGLVCCDCASPAVCTSKAWCINHICKQ